MSNRAYLIGNSTPVSPGIVANGLNYNPDSEILAGASWSIPILWASLFREEDITCHQVKEHKIPTLVTKYSDANRTFSSRLERINKVFSNCAEAIENWRCLLKEVSFEYIKVDTLEIWMLNEESFEKQLRSAIRWYESGAAEDRRSLIGLAEANYDAQNQRLVVPEGHIMDYCMHGYRWVREVPWKEQ